MESKRSSLRKPIIGNKTPTTNQKSTRRRISFNSRKSIREYRQEEKVILDYEVSDINSETGASPNSNQKIISAKSVIMSEEYTCNIENIAAVGNNNNASQIRDSLESVNKSMRTFSNFECSVDVTLFNHEQHLQKNANVVDKENCKILRNNSLSESDKKNSEAVWESSDDLLNSIPSDQNQNKHTQQVIEQISVKKADFPQDITGVYQMNLFGGPSKTKMELSEKIESVVPLLSEYVTTETVMKTKSNEGKTKQKNRPRFSQADEMLLENTTFLTQVKLGDETTNLDNSSFKRNLMGIDSSLGDTYLFTDMSHEMFPAQKIAGNKVEKNTMCNLVNEDNVHFKENIKGLSNLNVLRHGDCNMEIESGFTTQGEQTNSRKTILLHENIQTDEATMNREFLQTSKFTDQIPSNKTNFIGIQVDKNNTKSRKTEILDENIVDVENVQTKRIDSVKGYSKRRQTMMFNENIEIDDTTLPLESSPFKKPLMAKERLTNTFKQSEIPGGEKKHARSRKTLILHENVVEDTASILPDYSHGAIRKSKCAKEKSSRESILRIEPMNIEMDDVTKQTSVQQTKDEHSKIRRTMIMHDDIEEEVKAYPLGSLDGSCLEKEKIKVAVFPSGEQPEKIQRFKNVAKGRQTIMLHEDIESDVPVPQESLHGAISKDKTVSEMHCATCEQRISVEQDKYHVKERKTMILNENIEEYTSTVSTAYLRNIPLKYQIVDESVTRENKCIKGRQTMLLNENIEIDVTAEPSECMSSKNKVIRKDRLSSYEKSEITNRDEKCSEITVTAVVHENLKDGTAGVLPDHSHGAIPKSKYCKENHKYHCKSINKIEPIDIEIDCTNNKISTQQNEVCTALNKDFISKCKTTDEIRFMNDEQTGSATLHERNTEMQKTIILHEDIEEETKTDPLGNLFAPLFKNKNIAEVFAEGEQLKNTENDIKMAEGGQTMMQLENVGQENIPKVLLHSTSRGDSRDKIPPKPYIPSDEQRGRLEQQKFAKGRSTMMFLDNIEKDTAVVSPEGAHYTTSKFKTTERDKNYVNGNKTIILNENMEEDLIVIPQEDPHGISSLDKTGTFNENNLKGRKTVMLNEYMEEDVTDVPPKDEFGAILRYETAGQDKKSRQAIMSNKSMDEGATLVSQEGAHGPTVKYKTAIRDKKLDKVRSTMISNENMEEDSTTITSEGPRTFTSQVEIAVQSNMYVKVRKTMILNENIKEDTAAVPQDCSQSITLKNKSVERAYAPVKGRPAMVLNEKMQEDSTVSAPEGARDISAKWETADRRKKFENVEQGPVVVPPDGVHDIAAKYKVGERDKTFVREKQTIIFNENMEEGATALPQESAHGITSKYKTADPDKKFVKKRQTIVLNENMEEDSTTPSPEGVHGITSKYKTTGPDKKFVTKRQTIMLKENIEEDATALPQESAHGVISKYKTADPDKKFVKKRQTIMLNENMEEDSTTPSPEGVHGITSKYKTTGPDKKFVTKRQTIMLKENIEEDATALPQESAHGVTSNKTTDPDKKFVKKRQTIMLNENMEEDSITPSPEGVHGIISKYKTTDPEKKCVTKRQTIMLKENIEEDATALPQESAHGVTSKYKTSEPDKKFVKKRQTIMLNENMEEDSTTPSPEGVHGIISKYTTTDPDKKFIVKKMQPIMLNETMEDDVTSVSQEDPHSNTSKSKSSGIEQCKHSKKGKTVILGENLENNARAISTLGVCSSMFKDKSADDTNFTSIEQFGWIGENDSKYVQGKQTTLLNEHTVKNEVGSRSMYSQGAIPKDKNGKRKGTNPRESIHRIESMEIEMECSSNKISPEQTGTTFSTVASTSKTTGEVLFMNDEQPVAPNQNKQGAKPRKTMILHEDIAEEIKADPFSLHKTSMRNENINKGQKENINKRQTTIFNESIEEVPSKSLHSEISNNNEIIFTSNEQPGRTKQHNKKNVKSRQTIILNENIEEDVTESLHGGTSKDDKSKAEIQIPCCKQYEIYDPDKKKHSTRRQTEIFYENIEEDNSGVRTEHSHGAIPKKKTGFLTEQRKESVHGVESMDIEVECVSDMASSRQLKDNLPDPLYSTPSKTSANQERLRKLHAITPRQSLLEFTRLERTILMESNTSHNKLAFLNDENQTFKTQSAIGNIKVDMSGLELNDSNLTEWRSTKQLHATQTGAIQQDNVNIRMSTLFKEAFGNLQKTNNSSIQDVRRHASLHVSSITNINLSGNTLQNANDIADKSIIKPDITKNLTNLNQPNVSCTSTFNNLALPQLQYTDVGQLSDDEPITLVSTLVNNNDDDNDDDDIEFLNEITITSSAVHHEVYDNKPACSQSYESNCNNATYTKFCRKCQQCQRTLTDKNRTSLNNDDTFPIIPILPPISIKNSLDNIYEKLDRLQKRPRLRDINNLWHQMSLNHSKNQTNFTELQLEIDEIDTMDDMPKIWMEYKEDMAQFEKKLAEKYKKKKALMPVVDQLENLLGERNLTQWIFDHDFEISGVYMFTNRQSSTFKLRILFDELCPLGTKIRIKKVQFGHRIEQDTWKPIDFLLDIQLKLKHQEEMLLSLCKGHDAESICDMLQTLQQSIENTMKLGNELQHVITNHNALLKRGLNRLFLHKVIRRIVPCPETYDRVEKIEFEIDIMNIRDVNYRNIVRPRLHNFQEIIELLPVGLEFLNEFLADPFKFLKPDLIDSLFN